MCLRAGAADDERRGDALVATLDGGDAASLDLDGSDRCFLDNADAAGTRGTRETERAGRGVGPAIARAEGASQDAVQRDGGIERLNLVGRHPAGGHAEGLLERQMLLKDGQLGRIRQQEEVALLA